jgi:dipeptidyl aminopeptidase/acylaminoacyl peptidase
MLLSGGLPAPRFLHTDRSSTNENCPVLIAHGTDDDRIGLEGGALRTEKVLKEFGWKDVRMKIYEGLGHSASEDEMRDIFQFLQEVIPEASGASSQSKM